MQNNNKIVNYCNLLTSSESILLKNLRAYTESTVLAGDKLLTNTLENRLLKLIVQISNPKNILEIGTFTGYSALSMAEALSVDGTITTIEINPLAIEIAHKFIQKSPHGHKIKIIQSRANDYLETLQDKTNLFDLIFIDADKKQYDDYYDASIPLLKSGGIMILDNMLWKQGVINPISKTDEILDRLNKKIVSDSKVENILLPISDGVNIVRKK